MEKLWQHIKKCQDRFDDYLKLKWTQMDLGEMEDEIKKMRTGLQPIKIADRKCNTFVGISEDIKRWSIFIPMISDLKHDSMITPDGRHWKKVKDTVKQDFKVDQNLELKLLWNYRLFDYKETIE
jgi:dynein heavy chain